MANKCNVKKSGAKCVPCVKVENGKAVKTKGAKKSTLDDGCGVLTMDCAAESGLGRL